MNHDYRLALMAGIAIPIPELQLTIHAPTIKEIAYMGEQQFFMASQYLCLQKEQLIQDKTLLSSLSNFQVLMKILEQSEDKNKKTAIVTLLTLLFPDYIPMLTKNSIILSSQVEGQQPVLIDDKNFDILQDVAKEVLCIHNVLQRDNIVYNPANSRAQEIADKLNKAKQKIQAMKVKEGSSNESVLTRYVSILTVAKVCSLDECLGYNLFQLFDLMERYTGYQEWDADFRVRLAGGTPDQTPESWMRDLHGTNQVQAPTGVESSQIKVYK